MSPDQSASQMGQSVGAKLRTARIAKKYTQSQLAAPEFSVSYISAIERGQIHPSLRALEILARRLDLPSTHLLPERSQTTGGQALVPEAEIPDEDEVELTHLHAHIAILQGQPQHAIEELTPLATKNLKPNQQIYSHYLLGYAYLSTEQLQSSEQELTTALQLARTENDTYIAVRIQYLLGQVYIAMRNQAQAIQLHQECLQQLEQQVPRDPFMMAQVYNRLSSYALYQDNVEQAAALLKQAIDILDDLTESIRLRNLYWDMAEQYKDADQDNLAMLYAYKSLYLYDNHLDTFKGMIYHSLGRALMKQDREEARTYLEQALEKERAGHDTSSQASILTHLAEANLLANNIDSAVRYAEEAHDLTTSMQDNSITAEALLVLGRVRYAQQQYEEGDEAFVRALELLERLQAIDDLADQAVVYAQLLEERGKHREALTYYRRAFESSRKSADPTRV